MDDIDNPSISTADQEPAPKKPARGRPKGSTNKTKTTRTRRKSSDVDASPSAPETAQLELPAANDAPASTTQSYSEPAPRPEPAPEPAKEKSRRDETPEERPVFTPQATRYSFDPSEPSESSNDTATVSQSEEVASDESPRSEPHGDNSSPQDSGKPPSQSPSDSGQSGSGEEEDKGPWWKRKKDKKRQKWMEKQQAKGGGRGAHPPQPPPTNSAPQKFGDLPAPSRFDDLAALDAKVAAMSASTVAPIYLNELYALGGGEMSVRARSMGLTLPGVPTRLQWLEAILLHAGAQQIPIMDKGWLDLSEKGHGFVVHEHANYRLYPEDALVPSSLIIRHGLKRGQQVEVYVDAPQPGDRCPAVIGIKSVMGRPPEEIANLTPFEELVPYYPLQRILLEAPGIHKDISMRAIDLLTPVGFGQRGLIVAPPRTGKTVLLQNIANSISHNFPEKKLILLLIDERPEEVTDFKRHTKGEVVSSTFDEAPESHVHAAEMVIEKARRMVEMGEHVVILLDSITRLARAYNALASNSGKIMSGGVEANALQKPKRFFGSARNIEGAGSLTILGTALIDTGSRMDEVIFEEFKGTGNMELHLDRGLSDKRIFPAINIDRSGTRKEELIYHPDEMQRVYGLRRAMQGIPPVEAMDMFIQRLKKTKTNAEFLLSLSR